MRRNKATYSQIRVQQYRNTSSCRAVASGSRSTPVPGCHVPGSWIAHGLPHLHVPALRAVLRLHGRRDWPGRDAIQLQPGCPGRQRRPPCLQVSFCACIIGPYSSTSSCPRSIHRLTAHSRQLAHACTHGTTCLSKRSIPPTLPHALVCCVLCPHHGARGLTLFCSVSFCGCSGDGIEREGRRSDNIECELLLLLLLLGRCFGALKRPTGIITFHCIYKYSYTSQNLRV